MGARFRHWIGAIAVGLCLLGAVATPAAAAPPRAVLDPSFGESGVLRIPSESPAVANGLATASGLLVSSGSGVEALGESGAPAKASGIAGSLALPAPPSGEFIVTDLVTDDVGRILILGETVFPASENPSPFLENGMRAFEPGVVRIVRLLPDGSLDPTFGTGGVVETSLGLPPPRDINGHRLGPHPVVEPAGLALDPRNRIVITGSSVFGMSRPCSGHDSFAPVADSAGFVARFEESGKLDRTLGTDGVIGGRAIPGTPLGATGLGDPAIDPVGGITVRATGATICDYRRSHLGLARLTPDGPPSKGFGKKGAIYGPYSALLGKPNGTIFALAPVPRRRPQEDFKARLIRNQFLQNGAFDPTFGKDGGVTLTLGPGYDSVLDSLAADPQGRVLVGGRIGHGSSSALVLMRVSVDGRWERGFGPQGRVVTPMPGLVEYGGSDMFFDPQGRLLVVRLYEGSATGGGGLLIARYLLS